jgi:hypothetical protein
VELRRTEILPSPRAAGWTRLAADVVYYDGVQEQYWLEVPDERGNAFSRAGDGWAVWLAPLALTLGEPLRLAVPCDAHLTSNVREVMRIWSAWFPDLRLVSLHADVAAPEACGEHAASFFSGGVDSFFTALRHANGDGTPATEPIDDHLFVWGFDIPLGNEAGWRQALTSVTRAVEALGRRLVPVVTNVRETRYAHTDWSRLSHGAALAGIVHALGRTYRTGLIPSSAGYRDLRFWGSHPLTDPMLSSSQVRIVHDGAAFMRLEKTEYIAHHALVQQHLRVCYRDSGGGNCGRCNNCYRTMLALEALGVLGEYRTFDRRTLDLRRAERVYCPNDFDIRQFGYVRDLARRTGRRDIEHAVEQTLRASARRHRWVQRVRRLRDAPLAWRWAPAWERMLLRGWVV